MESSKELLTVGIAVYDDPDLRWTLQVLDEFHPEVSLLVLNNAPKHCPATERATLAVGGKYFHRPDLAGTAASRDHLFRIAKTPWVLVCDAHVIFGRGSVAAALAYAHEYPDSNDLVTGPLVYDDGRAVHSYWKPHGNDPDGVLLDGVWEAAPPFYGKLEDKSWRQALPEMQPHRVRMQGLGVFMMRRAAWPGFHPLFAGFGAEEGYLAEKVRQRGGQAVSLPQLIWRHRFPDELSPKKTYPRGPWDHARNLLLAHRELAVPGVELVRSRYAPGVQDGPWEAVVAEVERAQPEGVEYPRVKPQRILGVFYTNNKAPLPLIQKSLRTIKTARECSRHQVTVVVCSWEPIAGADGLPWISARTGVREMPGHAAILHQIKSAAAFAQEPELRHDQPYDAVVFLEHDVLVASDHFDKFGNALFHNPDAPVISNHDYIGLNATGYLATTQYDDPQHQLCLRWDAFQENMRRCEAEVAEQQWCHLEPSYNQPEGKARWVILPPKGQMPAVHVEHQAHFTDHHKVAYAADSSGVTDHPYWGKHSQWFPGEVVAQQKCAPCQQAAQAARNAVGPAGPAPATLDEWFQQVQARPADFHEHMGFLRELATGQDCAELSGWWKSALLAMAAGKPKRLLSYTLDGSKQEWGALRQFLGESFNGRVVAAYEREHFQIEECDLLMIDTRHQGRWLLDELRRHAPRVRKRLVVHCTETFGVVGDHGVHGDGVLYGINTFLGENPDWTVETVRTNNHGLQVLARTGEFIPTAEAVPEPTGGPGTELKAILASLGVRPGPDCDCHAYAAHMDRLGFRGCREKQAEVVEHLKANSQRWGWAAFVAAGVKAVFAGLAFKINPLNPMASLVELAIVRAEVRAEKTH